MQVLASINLFFCILVATTVLFLGYTYGKVSETILTPTQMDAYKPLLGEPKTKFHEQKNKYTQEVRWIGETTDKRLFTTESIISALIIILFGLFGVNILYRILLYITVG